MELHKNRFQNVKNVKTLFQNLTLEEQIVAVKSFAISKIIFQPLIAPAPSHIIKALETIQTFFLWNDSNPKIKHKTICKNKGERGLKNFDIRNRLAGVPERNRLLSIDIC